ncbi:hypothetical protein BH11PLA2_BH11PLA2_09500 [soil metagenome]
MESWRIIFRDGFAPSLSTKGLLALRDGLHSDDARLTQGMTTMPLMTSARAEWPCEGACALGYAAWQGGDRRSVSEVDEFFAMCCWEADDRLGEANACREFLNWHDDTPRNEMIADLLAEVELELAHRLPPPEPKLRKSALKPAPSRPRLVESTTPTF